MLPASTVIPFSKQNASKSSRSSAGSPPVTSNWVSSNSASMCLKEMLNDLIRLPFHPRVPIRLLPDASASCFGVTADKSLDARASTSLHAASARGIPTNPTRGVCGDGVRGDLCGSNGDYPLAGRPRGHALCGRIGTYANTCRQKTPGVEAPGVAPKGGRTSYPISPSAFTWCRMMARFSPRTRSEIASRRTSQSTTSA